MLYLIETKHIAAMIYLKKRKEKKTILEHEQVTRKSTHQLRKQKGTMHYTNKDLPTE